MLTCTNGLTRLANAHEYSRHNTLRSPWQDFTALNFDICGFTGVIIVVLNTKFKLHGKFLYTLKFVVSVKHLYLKSAVSSFGRHATTAELANDVTAK